MYSQSMCSARQRDPDVCVLLGYTVLLTVVPVEGMSATIVLQGV